MKSKHGSTFTSLQKAEFITTDLICIDCEKTLIAAVTYI